MGALSRVLRSLGSGPYRLRVLCYIREFLEFASSSYAQEVHANGYVDTLEGYCHSHFRRPLSSLVQLWRDVADKAVFLHYDRSSLLNQDIVEDFFQRAGLTPPAPISSSYDANPSISGNLLAFKLLVNQRGGHDIGLYNTFSDIARLDRRYRGKVFISDKLAQFLRAHDGGYNKQLLKLVGSFERRSFEDGNAFDPASWKSDLDRFVSHPGMASFKDRPEIAHASAEDVAELMGA